MTRIRKINGKHGFSLIELMISMVVGLIVLGAATALFKTGMDTTFAVTQRAETQQNLRAGMDLLIKDINMAGSGITGGIQLPSGTGSSASSYGCDQAPTCYVQVHAYPLSNHMYGIIPGFHNGVQGVAAGTVTNMGTRTSDSITTIYVDYNFPLFEYNATFATVAGQRLNLVANSSYTPAPPAINSPGGIKVGDLILVNGTAVGEVTGLAADHLDFANLDALNINQSGAAANNLAAIATAVGTSANVNVQRLLAVTYYLKDSAGGQAPRLMRQVNGLTPVPVADGINSLQFSYDVYNSTSGAIDANQRNPLGAGESPNLIQKVNIVVMGQSLGIGNKQNAYLATAVSARNMAFRNRYN